MDAQQTQSDLEAILSHRFDNGADYWATADGRLGVGSPFSTMESLVTLHELAISAGHESVRGALDLLLGSWREDGRFRLAPKGAIYPCQTANTARILCRFGLAEDERLKRTFVHLLETPYEDGGWRCNKFSFGRGPETEFSNPGVTLFALDAFRFTDHRDQKPALDRAVATLLDHWDVRRPTGPCQFGIGTLFMQVEYPFFRYNLFYYVYVLSHYGSARQDSRFLQALDLLQEKLDEEGRIIVERPNRRMSGLHLCRRGAASEPATRRYAEILTNMD